MADLLQQTKAAISKRKKTAEKKDNRWVITIGPKNESRAIIESLVELAHLNKEIEPQLSQHKSAAQTILFNMWTEKMWETKSVPDNPRIVLPKNDGGMEDHRCMLQVKFRSNGLDKVVPDGDDLPEGQTVHEVLFESLVGIGLSKKNARSFVDEEVEVAEKMILRDISAMYYGSDAAQKTVATKILEFINKRSKTGKGQVSLITDEEMLAVGDLFETEQKVLIKDGMFERVWNYCDNLDQLRELLNFCNVTVQVSHFEYALSDSKSDQSQRAAKAAKTYLLTNDGE